MNWIIILMIAAIGWMTPNMDCLKEQWNELKEKVELPANHDEKEGEALDEVYFIIGVGMF